MFSFFSNRLTKISNHYIDWSRIGSLIHSNHRYSSKELIIRGIIITATGVSAYLGYQYNNDIEADKQNYSTLTLTLAAGTLGFVLSHTLAITPLIYKRYQMNRQCQELITDIKNLTNDMDLANEELHKMIDFIMQSSLADEKRSNASLTWGNRRTLLKDLKEELSNNNKIKPF